MADGPTFLQLLSEAFETRFGGWQQPDELDPCRAGFGGCPVQWTSGYELRKLAVRFSRAVGSTPPQDAAVCTFHFLNLTGDEPDASWTTADYVAVETAFNSFWNGLSSNYNSQTRSEDFVWRADGPAFRPFGASLSPTLRLQATNHTAGAASAEQLSPQTAVSVTEVIPATFVAHDVAGVGDQTRNRWGRFYLPAPIVSVVQNGRWTSAFAEDVATRCQTFYNACVTADLIPVVYSPTTGHAWSLDAVHVDDLCDVIRSHRYTAPLSRHSKAITAP